MQTHFRASSPETNQCAANLNVFEVKDLVPSYLTSYTSRFMIRYWGTCLHKSYVY